MAEILNTKGGMVKIYDNKDFALFLDESLGYEVGDYFRIALEDVANAATGENRCTGECDLRDRRTLAAHRAGHP